MPTDNRLPEGTDSIIEGAGVGSYAEPTGGAGSGGFATTGAGGASGMTGGAGAGGGTGGSAGGTGASSGASGGATGGKSGGTGGSGAAGGAGASAAATLGATGGAGGAGAVASGAELAKSPSPAPAPPKSARETLDEAREKVGDLRGQAAEKAREYAVMGKDRAADSLENVQRMIGDAAATVDEKVGEQYGDYVRQAADTVAGLASTLREKDVDELLGDARDMVRQSPAVAIGAATALGFVLARMVKVGIDGATAGSTGGGDEADPVRDRTA
jgi:ElaB/YqjD/DUF883 family membrane-anchored ribosome-binding protein